jgi:hypothetical protein
MDHANILNWLDWDSWCGGNFLLGLRRDTWRRGVDHIYWLDRVKLRGGRGRHRSILQARPASKNRKSGTSVPVPRPLKY